jgi:hypothetical protein
MATALNILPTNIIAGESIVKVITVPSTTDTAVYQFASETPLEIALTEDTGVYTLSVSSAQTTTFKRGSIRFVGLSTDVDGVVSCFDSGSINVEASPMATSNYSAALTAIRTAIQNWGTSENKRVQLGDMSVEVKDIDDLLRLEDYYKRLVALDTGTSNYSGGPIRILTRF